MKRDFYIKLSPKGQDKYDLAFRTAVEAAEAGIRGTANIIKHIGMTKTPIVSHAVHSAWKFAKVPNKYRTTRISGDREIIPEIICENKERWLWRRWSKALRDKKEVRIEITKASIQAGRAILRVLKKLNGKFSREEIQKALVFVGFLKIWKVRRMNNRIARLRGANDPVPVVKEKEKVDTSSPLLEHAETQPLLPSLPLSSTKRHNLRKVELYEIPKV